MTSRTRKRVASINYNETEEEEKPKRGKAKKPKDDDESATTTKPKPGSKKTKNNDVSQDEPATKKRGRPKKQDVKDEEEDTKPPVKNSKTKVVANGVDKPTTSKAANGVKGKKKKKEEKINGVTDDIKTEPVEEKTGVARKVVKKGIAPIDGQCTVASHSHVYHDTDEFDNQVIWDCMLNQTNIQFNNNKFYLIQLLQDDKTSEFYVWMRWGRVGANGQNSLSRCGSNLDQAKKIFTKKFNDKTKNDWDLRDCFEKVPGKYDLLKMDYSGAEDDIDSKPIKTEDDEPLKKVESQLEAAVKALIELICDLKVMEDAVTEMKYDAKKAPLGKLTTSQITAGYAALKKIDDLIIGSKVTNKDLLEACNAFYTRIPHYFGMKVPPLIQTQSDVREKLKLLEALGDIQAALDLIKKPINVDTHPTDQRYMQLSCDIKTLDKGSPTFKLLEKYLQTTHGSTHRGYKMKVLDIFECHKSTEVERFNDVGNRKLLWHGSRLSNWAGILGQGLRIAPPEAPVTGYMFGKGVYFADMSSKSANYCCTSYRNPVGLLTLCEVALGTPNELLNAKYDAHKLPSGCHSVKGLGLTAPDSKNAVYLDDGTEIPMGPGVKTNVTNKNGYTLQYNEFIVYNVNQIKIRYLMKVHFGH